MFFMHLFNLKRRVSQIVCLENIINSYDKHQMIVLSLSLKKTCEHGMFNYTHYAR